MQFSLRKRKSLLKEKDTYEDMLKAKIFFVKGKGIFFAKENSIFAKEKTIFCYRIGKISFAEGKVKCFL